jgi:hypothetical protein
MTFLIRQKEPVKVVGHAIPLVPPPDEVDVQRAVQVILVQVVPAGAVPRAVILVVTSEAAV